MLNNSLLNEVVFNGTRTRFPIYKLGNFSFNILNYASKILLTSFDIAVILYQKIRVFINRPSVKIRTKRRFF